jgi:hypothetical protein
MASGNYTVKIAGQEISGYESIDTDNTLDLNVNKASIIFPDLVTLNKAFAALGVNPIESDAQILRDNVLLWRGYVQDYERQVTYQREHRQYALTCISNKAYLNREAFRYPPNGVGGGKSPSYFNVIYGGGIAQSGATSQKSTLATSIFNDILNCQKGASGNPTSGAALTQGIVGPNNGDSDTPHVCLFLIRTTALMALAQLIDGSLWEARFNPNNTVDFQTQTGSLTSVKTFNEGENIVTIDDKYGVDQKINDVVVCGSGSASAVTSLTGGGNAISDNGISFEVDNSPPAGPRYTKIVNVSNICDLNLLNAYANALSKDLQFPLETITVEVTDLLPGVNWHLGDVVTLNSPTMGINGSTYRILKEKRKFGYQKGEEITLTLQSNSRMATISHTRVRALEFILNSQTGNQQLFANSVTQSPQQNPTSVSVTA